MTSDRLAHLWGEYTKTLHPQKERDNFGQAQVVRWRATCLAGTFFTQEAVVDTPLRVEYYKHSQHSTGIGIWNVFWIDSGPPFISTSHRIHHWQRPVSGNP